MVAGGSRPKDSVAPCLLLSSGGGSSGFAKPQRSVERFACPNCVAKDHGVAAADAAGACHVTFLSVPSRRHNGIGCLEIVSPVDLVAPLPPVWTVRSGLGFNFSLNAICLFRGCATCSVYMVHQLLLRVC